ncbi:hypothetical protein [Bacillus bingmayongensis]|uniref:hypothetical protein n=1 Tax=Bacillus bingmayongensis TaxID=1150157 RepID=UPI001C8D9A02|nr:hypothetical protein [Bacillus bingmayongensis]MBY0598976.1 hypothetical protein [Bacillus bingmayongensis]
MARIKRDKKIFTTDSSQVMSWDEIKGQKLVQIKTSNEKRRGYDEGFDITAKQEQKINVQLTKWTELDFFLKAMAEVSLRVQAQTPLNLFDEAGVAIRLQALAKAAIAIGIESNLTVDELKRSLLAQPEMSGLPGKLIELILDEVILEGVLYAQAAVAIMAYANTVMTGSFFKSEDVLEPSFQMLFEYGYGFIAGGGYHCFVQAKIPNSRRLVNLISDLIVSEILKLAEEKNIASFQIGLVEAPLKMGLRLAYEIGEGLENSSVHSDQIMKTRSAGIIIEEGQRWFLRQLASLGGEQITSILQSVGISSLDISSLFKEMPVNPDKMESHLNNIIGNVFLVISTASQEEMKASLIQSISILWSGWILYIEMSKQLMKKDVSQFEFKGSLKTDVPEPILRWINSELGNSTNQTLQIEDIISYLTSKPLNQMLQNHQEFHYMVKMFQKAFKGNSEEVVRQLFAVSPGNPLIPEDDLLENLYTGLQLYYTEHFLESINDILSQALPNNSESRMLLENALIPALDMNIQVVIPEIIKHFPNGQGRRKEILEGLSSALLPCIGRTIVEIFDGILSQTQQQIEKKLNEVANQIKNIDVPKRLEGYYPDKKLLEFMVLPLETALRLISTYVKEHPYPKEVFEAMKDVFTPIPVGQTLQYMENLRDPMWIPKKESLHKCMRELGEFLFRDMPTFSGQMIIALLDAMLKYLLKILDDLIDLVQKIVDEVVVKAIMNQLNTNIGIVEPIVKLFRNSDIIRFEISSIVLPFVRQEVENQIEGKIRESVVKVVFPAIESAFGEWKLDARNVLDAIRQGEIQGFIRMILNDLTNHLRQVLIIPSIDINIPVKFPDIKIPYYPEPIIIPGRTFNFEVDNVFLQPDKIIKTIIQETSDKFNWKIAYARIMRHARRFFQMEQYIESFIQKRPEIEREYGAEQNRSLPIIQNFHDAMLIVRPCTESFDNVELFIHLPGKSDLMYQGERGWDQLNIYLNRVKLSLQTFTYLDEIKILDRPSGIVLYRTVNILNLRKGVNVLHVVMKNSKNYRTEATTTFVIE